VLQIEECGCASSDSSTSRGNLWTCSVGSTSNAFGHFSAVPSQYAYAQHQLSLGASQHQFSLQNARQLSFAAQHQLAFNSQRQLSFSSQRQLAFNSQRQLSFASQRQLAFNSQRQLSFSSSQRQLVSNAQRQFSLNAHQVKRATSDTCPCLGAALSCLQSTSCSSSSSTVLDSLCSWNYGRLFGSCSQCSGLTQPGDGFATASDLMARWQEYEPSLSAAIVSLVPQISAISFSPNGGTSFLADVTVTAGVVDTTSVYNQLIYQMSRIFDVYPGTIQWSTVPASGKRQTPNQIIVTFYDEQLPSSHALAFAPVLVTALLSCLVVMV